MSNIRIEDVLVDTINLSEKQINVTVKVPFNISERDECQNQEMIKEKVHRAIKYLYLEGFIPIEFSKEEPFDVGIHLINNI